MSKLDAIRALANQAAETGIDMNDVQKGGGGRLLPEGWAFARFVEYIEFGKQPQEFQGKAKDPAMDVQLGFALYDTADRKYSNDDGTPYIIRPYSFALGRNEKSRAFKLFNAMNWRKQAKNYAQLLSDAFLVYICYEDKSKTDKTKVSRVDLDKVFPPLDSVSGMPLPIPEATEDLYQVFLWDYPTMEAWKAMFREGTWEDGRSKNNLQEKCLTATDFEGSALQVLLAGSAIPALPSAAPTAPVVPQANPTPALPVAPVAPVIPMSGTVGATAPSTVSLPPVTTPTTSPSSPVVPVMPAMPVMPSLPAMPSA